MFDIDKNQVLKEVKSVGPFLAPFIKTSCVYFILTFDSPTLIHAFVKVLPMLCLICFVCWIRRAHSSTYNNWVLAGLICCASGDVVLIWQDVDQLFFIAGMVLFVFGHMSYIFAFGFTPFGLVEFVLSSFASVAIYAALLPGLPSLLMVFAVGIYTAVIGAMAWRAVARFNLRGEIPWRKIYAAIGAILFIVSDVCLAVNKFIYDLPRDKEMIMVPYYLAQMGIALSVMNLRHLVHKRDENKLKPVLDVTNTCNTCNTRSAGHT